jgi:hypothetical protein
MPKKFDDAKKKEWIEFYDQGKSEKWIANRAGCDVRTVRNAINEARLKRDVVVARMELVKDALRKHQDGLLEELDRIMSYLVVPPKNSAVLSWYRGGTSIFNDAGEQIKLESGEDSAMSRLLKEHLKNDKLWRVLHRWEKANADHLAAKAAFQRNTATVLQQKTGCKLIDGRATPPFIYSETGGRLLYEAAIDMAFAAPDERAQESVFEKMEMGISVNTNTGDVLFKKDLTLAEAPGSEEATKQHLLDALKDLGKSPEVRAMVETHQALQQITTKARQIVEDIRLLGLVPGQCEICRRLGM